MDQSLPDWDSEDAEQRIKMVALWQLSDGRETTRLLLQMLARLNVGCIAGWTHDYGTDEVEASLLKSEEEGWVTRWCALGQPNSLTVARCAHRMSDHPRVGGDPNDVDPRDLWWELTPTGQELVGLWVSQFVRTSAQP